MTRLTFGIKTSPFLASRVLLQLAKDLKERYPEASEIVRTSFYVDDCITGADTPEEALRLQQSLVQLLSEAQMMLRKWRSNSPQVLDSIPELLREKSDLTIREPGSASKTLGIHWSTEQDCFYIQVLELPDGSASKRTITAAAARIFDLFGWFAPSMLFVKSLIQQLWLMGRGWDKPVPPDIQKHFDVWRNELPYLNECPVPRRLVQHKSQVLSRQLHGFLNASQAGYRAVIYVRTLHSDASMSMEIMVAKAKVTPKKMVADSRSRLELTIPRLEVLAAHLLSQLMSTTAASLKIPEEWIYCWTDSQIVLAWLKKPPEKVDTFVKNRTCKIPQSVPEGRWNNVRTKDNPADVASRGLSPSQLVKKEQCSLAPAATQRLVHSVGRD